MGKVASSCEGGVTQQLYSDDTHRDAFYSPVRLPFVVVFNHESVQSTTISEHVMVPVVLVVVMTGLDA